MIFNQVKFLLVTDRVVITKGVCLSNREDAFENRPRGRRPVEIGRAPRLELRNQFKNIRNNAFILNENTPKNIFQNIIAAFSVLWSNANNFGDNFVGF